MVHTRRCGPLTTVQVHAAVARPSALPCSMIRPASTYPSPGFSGPDATVTGVNEIIVVVSERLGSGAVGLADAMVCAPATAPIVTIAAADRMAVSLRIGYSCET